MAEDDENRQLSAILLSIGSPRSAYANRYVRGTAFVENERAGRITAQTFATDLGEPMGSRIAES